MQKKRTELVPANQVTAQNRISREIFCKPAPDWLRLRCSVSFMHRGPSFVSLILGHELTTINYSSYYLQTNKKKRKMKQLLIQETISLENHNNNNRDISKTNSSNNLRILHCTHCFELVCISQLVINQVYEMEYWYSCSSGSKNGSRSSSNKSRAVIDTTVS